MLRALHARPARNFRHGYRVIAGDDLDLHPLLGKIAERLLRVGAQQV